METQHIVISCLTYQIFLLYFGRSCFLGIRIDFTLMFSERTYDPPETWLTGCSCSIAPTVLRSPGKGPKISRMKSVESI